MKRSHKDIKIGKKRKPWHKPCKRFKRCAARIRRSKERQAVVNDKDVPRFRKTDVWDYN